MARPGKATKQLRKQLRAIGTDPTRWTPQQRATHNRLSNEAMREQNQPKH